MGIESYKATVNAAVADCRKDLAGVRAQLGELENHPLLTTDIDVVVEAMTNLPPAVLKEQLRHQLVLGRFWHKTATQLVDRLEKSLDREAAAHTTAAGAHELVACTQQLSASILTLVTSKAA